MTQEEASTLYNDIELRTVCLPLAVALVNNEVQRTLNRCNTASVAEITKELVDIMRYGEVLKQSAEKAEVSVTPAPVKAKKPKVKAEGLKYA